MTALYCFYYGDDGDDDEPHFEFGIMAKLENNRIKFIQTTTIFEVDFFEFKEMVELAHKWQKRKCIVERWKNHRYLSLYCLHFRPGLLAIFARLNVAEVFD